MSNIIQIDGKFYDFGTKNTSFLKTAQELKTIGIKNWYFMLEVKFPNLNVQDIDPFNPDITPEDIGRVHYESKHNVWYWMREVARIPVRGAPKPMPLDLSRAGCAAIWCFDHSINFQLCQPRQTYKTTVCMLICEYAFIYEYKNVEIPFLHRDGGRCLKNAEMFRSYVEILPKYMNPWSKLNKLPGSKSLKYAEHGVSISVLSSSDSDEKAMDMLRGITMFMMLADEWEFIPHIAHLLAGASPAMESARAIAMDSGVRCCIMYLSTPGDQDTQSGKESQRIIDNTPNFTEKMYEFTDEDVKAFFNGMFNKDENGDPVPVTTVYIEFNYKQLRKDDVYLRKQYAEAAAKNELSEYRRGTLLQRFRGSGSELFKQEDIDYINNHVKDPDHEILMLKHYILYVYNHEIVMSDMQSDTPWFDITIPYLVGIDVASGVGKGDNDNSAICIVHPYTLEVVGELQTPFMGPLDLMRVITQLALLMPKCLFCLESNSIGKAVVDFVHESQLEGRFYHDPKLDITQNAIMVNNNSEKSLRQRAIERGYIGTNVTHKVRETMMSLLKSHVKDYRNLLNTKCLVRDITSLTRDKTGKILAEKGAHDDMVMAYLHTLYVLYYGYDLTRFGIDKRARKYEKTYDVINAYETTVENNTINNLVPTEGGMSSYENMVLNDVMRNMGSNNASNGFSPNTDVDEYGYKKNDYVLNSYRNEERPTISDLSFFYDCNNLF